MRDWPAVKPHKFNQFSLRSFHTTFTHRNLRYQPTTKDNWTIRQKQWLVHILEIKIDSFTVFISKSLSKAVLANVAEGANLIPYVFHSSTMVLQSQTTLKLFFYDATCSGGFDLFDFLFGFLGLEGYCEGGGWGWGFV